MDRRYKNIHVDPNVSQTESAKNIETLFQLQTKKEKKDIISHYRDGKSTLALTEKKGSTFDTCSTIHSDYVCCNIKVVKAVKNCPFDCSYCFLQDYLNDGTTSVIADIEAIMEEIKSKISVHPWRLWRIGSWELGDSLALESLTHQARQLIEAFSTLPNAILELKTKSDCIEPILKAKHGGKTVVAWSLNTEHIIHHQEHRTASLEKRLSAMAAVISAGYPVALHFDPMIIHKNWKEGYTTLIEKIFSIAKPENIAWISVGSLRFNPEMKKKMEQNFPKQTLTLEEMILGDDGKVRYIKPLRLSLYSHIIDALKKALNVSSLSPLQQPKKNLPLFYFCMERPDIWRKTLGETPNGIPHLDYLFARSITKRFDMFPDLPEQKSYLYEVLEENRR
jgi:spore photoproduct lyase